MDSPPLTDGGGATRGSGLSSSADPHREPLERRSRSSRDDVAPAPPSSIATDIASLITPERVMANLAAANKTEALRLLAFRAASLLDADGQFLFDLLAARERLGSTATGRGYALPHTEWKGLPGFFGLFARLAKPIDFGATDGGRVDLVFLLLSPENAGKVHLLALASIARRMRNATIAARLRATRDARKLHELLVGLTA